MHINFMKVHHYPDIPPTEFKHKSAAKTKFADSIVENDTRIGRVMDKIRALGLDKNTYVFWTTDNGAWQDVYPDAGYTPYRGTKGTCREGGARVPFAGLGTGHQGRQAAAPTSSAGSTMMATFAALAGGVKLPEERSRGEKHDIIFDSYDMSPLLFGKGPLGAARAGSISPRIG